MNKMTLSTLFCGFLILWSGIVSADTSSSMRATLFTGVDETLKQANTSRASILAPDSYSAAAKLYNSADDMLKKGKNIDRIRRNLEEADTLFKKAIESTKLANLTFSNTIQARDDAEAAQADIYAKSSWEEAEKIFTRAALALEDGNINKARKYSDKAEAAFRDVELAAIKVNYLDETRTLIDQAIKAKVDRTAPKTLSLAQTLLDKAEKGLNENRYDTDESRLLAKQALYEAKHATYISKIVNRLNDDAITAEDLILDSEKPVVEIASGLDLVVQFDSGLERPTTEIRQQVDSLRQDSQELANSQSHVLTLEGEISSLEKKLGVQSQRLEKQEKHKQRLSQVESLFSPQEAIVMSQGGNILVRTIGLNFGSGSDQINSRNFGLLKKVQEALSLFPKSSVIVEGHTDSFGGDEINLNLSKSRAEAVKSYLMANMEGGEQMTLTSMGYGESKPIGNNETSEGRLKNRRIDLIIIPAD